MKFIAGVAATIALLTLSAVAAINTGNVTDGIRLRAEAPAIKIPTGEPVVVKGSLTNERAGKIALGTTDPLGGFRIVIVDAKGHSVRMNKSGRDLVKLVHRSKQELAPGEKIEQSLWLSSLYNLKKPGKYKITMTHDVDASNGLGKETVKSNTVSVWISKR